MNQMDILEFLRENGQATAPEIKRQFPETNRCRLYYKLNQLHKSGLVEKIEGHHDTIWRAIP